MGFDVYWANVDIHGDAPEPPGSYFRATIWAWGELLEEMEAQGMTYETPRPLEWPTWEEYAVPVASDGEPDVTSAAYTVWWSAYDLLLRAEDDNPPGLPSHKLPFNDYFVLTVAEIRAALERADATVITRPEDADFVSFWRDWLPYLSRAAEEGGGVRIT